MRADIELVCVFVQITNEKITTDFVLFNLSVLLRFGVAFRGHHEPLRATTQAPFTPLELAAGSPSHRLPDLYSRNLDRPENLGDPTGIVSRPTTTP